VQEEVAFLVEHLGVEAPARVLDLACGYGRHATALAARGFRVTGLDLSAPSLEEARRTSAEAGVEVEWIERDMRDLSFDGEFDAVLNLFTAFGYFDAEEDDVRVLDGVARALRPGGVFLIDTINPIALARRFQPSSWRELESGALFLEDRSWDLRRGRSEALWVLVLPDGERRALRHSARTYTYPELAAMMARAGLDVDADWGGFDGSEFGMDSWRMLIRARRR
jgi:SAM-dependent methyltransferase